MEADRYERTENRKAYRNGSYPHRYIRGWEPLH
ncbi:hypothetical protein P7H12_13315 [Paenibacillus larvae]|nr:hypothetical protein [Paenibacillus larvae]MDT2264375.1 hypothetical protein [Paenibacillus larvae]